MKITKIVIRNYRGIEALDADIAPGGAVVSGANGRGKTSVLKALRAALAAQDIGGDAVRTGADRAEILVNLDDLAVRRVITAAGKSTLTVKNGAGMTAPKPTAFLGELIGTSPLDPLDLLLAKPKDRRAAVLEALPLSVTAEQIRQWAPDFAGDTSGHGLEVISRVRDGYYATRTEANRVAAAAKFESARLEAAHAVLLACVPADAPTVDAAEAALAKARAELARLEAQDAESRKAEERGAATRARIDAVRKEAERAIEKAAEWRVAPGAAKTALARKEEASRAVASAEAALAAARVALADAVSEVLTTERAECEAAAYDADALRLVEQADELQGMLAAVAATGVPESHIALARADVEGASAAMAAAKRAAAASAAGADATRASSAHAAAAAEAARLDGIVRALTNDAPPAILASANGIPGLGLDGDEVTLDGHRIDSLCGSEQLSFCVDIAKRLNTKSRILLVDGLERLDIEQREAFVRFATADGYQLLATLVDKGDAVLAAIEPSDAAVAAE